jgi:hypothetical protein
MHLLVAVRHSLSARSVAHGAGTGAHRLAVVLLPSCDNLPHWLVLFRHPRNELFGCGCHQTHFSEHIDPPRKLGDVG